MLLKETKATRSQCFNEHTKCLQQIHQVVKNLLNKTQAEMQTQKFRTGRLRN
jgi:hypothetical protein